MHDAGFTGGDSLNWTEERDRLITLALSTGWCAAGTTTPDPFLNAEEHLLDALKEGRLTGMPWMHEQRAHASTHLADRFPWAQSIIALAWPYSPHSTSNPTAPERTGRIAAYALLQDGNEDRPEDYHPLLERKCQELVRELHHSFPDLRTKIFVDHGWAVDRAIAERAGIGFIGKNACLITQHGGSFVLLAAIVTSLPFPPTPPSRKSCGSCRTCIDSCPTGAILSPGVIDARKCISYWTIEHAGPVPEHIRPLIGEWVFGCDLCQDVCPINVRKALPQNRHAGSSPAHHVDLIELLSLDEESFTTQFGKTPIGRTGLERFLRNVIIALGNVGTLSALPHLEKYRAHASEDHMELCTWAAHTIQQRATEAPTLPLH
ncbi:MAG: tRNA epoxyqueuosine(34) reductase QueG [Candidatus Dormibacteria bacterium]